MSESFSGLRFVFDGDMLLLPGKEELKGYIESKGGRVTRKASGKTDYVVTNTPNLYNDIL